MSRIITRAQWGATTSKSPYVQGKVGRLYVHHTVTASTKGKSLEFSKGQVRQIENFHASKGWPAPGYQYLIDDSGRIFEGQGDRIGAHVAGQNSTSIGVSYLGNAESERPSEEAIDAYRWLIRHLKKKGRLTKDAVIDGHRNASGASTACPGRYLMEALPDIRKKPKKRFRIVARKVVKGGKRARRVVRRLRKRGWRVKKKRL